MFEIPSSLQWSGYAVLTVFQYERSIELEVYSQGINASSAFSSHEGSATKHQKAPVYMDECANIENALTRIKDGPPRMPLGGGGGEPCASPLTQASIRGSGTCKPKPSESKGYHHGAGLNARAEVPAGPVRAERTHRYARARLRMVVHEPDRSANHSHASQSIPKMTPCGV